MIFILAVFIFWGFRWYVQVQRIRPWKAAIGCGAALGLVHTAQGYSLAGAFVTGVIAAVASWLLVWVDERFHSLATIPIWLVATIGLYFLLALSY